VLGHKALDFPNGDVALLEQYIHVPVDRNERRYSTPDLETLLCEINEINKNKRIVYCAFGTIPYQQQRAVARFVSRLVELVNDRSDIFLILAKSKIEINVSESACVRVFDFVPQYRLLSYVDVMVTHGGMNSLNECLDRKVPMYVLPLNLNTDQPGNAARVVHNRLGVSGNIRYETKSLISEKLDHLFSTKDQLKENMYMLLNKSITL
jgi:UDP:flavonoid glycosyltransferase YjiC (YdhE family)